MIFSPNNYKVCSARSIFRLYASAMSTFAARTATADRRCKLADGKALSFSFRIRLWG